MTLWADPIIAEVHRVREMLAAKYNFDVSAFFADIRKRQAALGAQPVSPKKRAASTGGSDGSGNPNGPTPSEAAPAA